MDEQLRILKMLEEGKITAEQASELLDTVIDCLDAQVTGDIVNVNSSNGDIVKIFIG